MILLLGFLMMTGVAVAQQLQVQGKVTDATGEGLIGASVLVKGTTSGVITDIDGNYVLLNVNPDAILIFSYVGYQTQELNVSGRNKIDVVLHDDQQVLEEVVVVGYGSLSKKEVSSSIVQVDKKNFNLGAMNNPHQILPLPLLSHLRLPIVLRPIPNASHRTPAIHQRSKTHHYAK